MDASLITIVTLVVVICFQQYSIQKLMNKLMSRNYHEYETTVNLKKEQVANVSLDTGVPEDLRALSEYGLR